MIFRSLLTLVIVLSYSFVIGQTYLMNSSTRNITACGGFFMDSGGSSGSYGSLQNLTTTICPDRTKGSHTQLIFKGTQIHSSDDLCFFDGPNVNSPTLGCFKEFDGASHFIIQATAANSSGCVTVTFKSSLFFNSQGWSAEIRCIASCQLITAEIASTTPLATPVDTGWINVCPGDVVSFQGKGVYPQNGLSYQHSDNTSSFFWDFGDGTIEMGQNTSHQFNKPGGYLVNLNIVDQLGCKSTNSMTRRIRVAPKPYFEISSYPKEICSGDTLQLSALVNGIDTTRTVSVTSTEAKFQTQGVRADSLPLPDGTGSSYKTTISFNGFLPGQVLDDISKLSSVWVNMEHSWLRDLQIKLICPNGQQTILHDFYAKEGGEVHIGIPFQGDEGLSSPIPGVGYNYSWSPTPEFNRTWLQYSNTFLPSVLPPGSYKSFEPLTKLLQCPLNGDWTIEVTDLWAIDNGYIFSWGIAFDPVLYISVEKFSPRLNSWKWRDSPTTFFSKSDSIAASPANAGNLTYSFFVNDEFGCAWDTSIHVNVLPKNHLNCYDCKTEKSNLRDTVVCINEPVRLDATSVLPHIDTVTFESYPDYRIGFSNHPGPNPYTSVIDVNSVYPALIGNASNQIVSVCVDFETVPVRDIHMVLISPSGQIMLLASNIGGNGSNFSKTCFTTSPSTQITSGSAPFNGRYNPQGSWAAFNNINANGKWSLMISDAGGDGFWGTLKSWSITFRSFNSVSYEWNPPDLLSCKDCPNPVTTTSSSADYFVTIKDRFGCEIKDTMRVNIIQEFRAPVVSCSEQLNGEIHVKWDDVYPGLSYEVNINNKGWQASNNGLLSHIVRGLKIGDTVYAQVRAAVGRSGCVVLTGSSFCTLELCIAKAVALTQAPYSVSCNGLCDALIPFQIQNGSAPYRYDFTNLTKNTSFSQSGDTLANLCPGNYKLVVTDITNCRDSLVFSVLEPPKIALTLKEDNPVSCNGGSDGCASLNASGGNGPYSIIWGNPNLSIGNRVCGLSAGRLNVSISDALGCKVDTNLIISQPLPIQLQMTKTDVKCFGQQTGSATVTATGGNGNYIYQWSGGSNSGTASVSGLGSGNFSVTVQDAKACQAFASITVGQPATPLALSAAQTVRSCYNTDKSEVNANISGGTSPYKYLWSPGGQTTRTATNLAPGLYQLTATDANGCTATTTVLAAQWNPIQVSTIEKPPSCHNFSNGQVAANFVSGGNGTYYFKWSNGSDKAVADSLQGGFTYLVTVTDGQGCTGTASRQLTNPPAIAIESVASSPKCNSGLDGKAEITTVLYNKGSVKFLWDAAARNKTSAMVDSLRAGTYSVFISDSLGCSSAVQIVIPETPSIVINAKVTDNGCFGESKGTIDIAVKGGVQPYGYTWSNGSRTTSLKDLQAGTYRVSILDANGCLIVDSVLVAQPSTVLINTQIKDVNCNGEKNGSITVNSIGGSPPYSYSLTGTSFSSVNQFIALAAGSYTLGARDSKGCIFNTPVSIKEPPPFYAEILASGQNLDQQLIQSGDSVVLMARLTNNNGKVMLTWDASFCGTLRCNGLSDCDQTPFCHQMVAFPDRSVDYFLLAVDERGCEAKDHIQLHVKKERSVFVPTAFTPNADGMNDLLLVHGRSDTAVKVFQVFDRWGELLFQMMDGKVNDQAFGWDGYFKGKQMPGGVYIWHLEVIYHDGMKERFKGETTLLR